MNQKEKLQRELAGIEMKLEKCRTSTFDDGFGTSRFARKSRNWDYYAKKRTELRIKLSELENA